MEVYGSELNNETRRHVLARFVNRFTRDHKPQWANKPRPDGTRYMVQFDSDEDWLAHTLFHIKADGSLDNRYTSCFSSPTWPDGKDEKR